jgi:hypothetical protein
MASLLAVIDRASPANMLLVEEYLARVAIAAAEPSTPSPAAAGGEL